MHIRVHYPGASSAYEYHHEITTKQKKSQIRLGYWRSSERVNMRYYSNRTSFSVFFYYCLFHQKEKVFSPSCTDSIYRVEFIFIIIINGRKILLSFNACMPHPVIKTTYIKSIDESFLLSFVHRQKDFMKSKIFVNFCREGNFSRVSH